MLNPRPPPPPLANRSLIAIDVVLESVVARVAEQGLDKLRSEPERQRLRQMASRLPDTAAIFIFDKVGDVITDTPSYPFAVNVSDREWFRILRDGKEDVHVGRALKGRSVHSLFFPARAREVADPKLDWLDPRVRSAAPGLGAWP